MQTFKLGEINQDADITRTQLAAIVDSTDDAIIGKTLDGIIISWNRAAEKIFGYLAAEAIGQSILMLLPPERQDEETQIWLQVEQGIPVIHFDTVRLHKDGRRIDTAVTVSPIRDLEGNVIGASKIARDITERKRAEEALRDSEETYRSLFTNMLNGFAHCRILFEDGVPRDFVYLRVNEAFETLTGLRDVVGRKVSEVIPGIRESDPSLFLTYGRVACTRKPERFETYVKALDMWFSISVYSPKEGEVVAVFDVITERKQAEASIKNLNASLERRVEERTADLAAANRELEGFAYAVSHDLRAPLRALNGFSRALIEDSGPLLTGEPREHLEEIIRASRRMGELIDGILVLSRSSLCDQRCDNVDLSALAALVRNELMQTEPDRQAVWDIEQDLIVRGDPRMLEAVMRNLLGNAWKYSAHASPPHIRFFAEDRVGRRYFCVADNGAGFDMAHANLLFKPFQRLHREDEFPGLGIGLATVQRIINRHGGDILASASPGQGAEFYFTLPA